MSDGSSNLEYLKIHLRISSLQTESLRHGRGEELGVFCHCQHLALPSPQCHDGFGYHQHTLAMQGLQERLLGCFTCPECVQGSLCCDGCVDVFWLPSSGLKQLSSAPLPAPHRVDVIPENCFWPQLPPAPQRFWKLRLKHCLSLPQCIHIHHVLATLLKWKTRVKFWELCFSVHLSLEIWLLFLPYTFLFFTISKSWSILFVSMEKVRHILPNSYFTQPKIKSKIRHNLSYYYHELKENLRWGKFSLFYGGLFLLFGAFALIDFEAALFSRPARH